MQVWKIILCLCAVLLTAGPSSARSLALHWAKLHVYHAEPSQVFARLGLTHNTRYGHTLGQKRVPDPNFPPGLTDVVPYDPDHTLLVRGTTQGVALFRQRVAAVDVPEPHWQAVLTLTQQDPLDSNAAALGVQNQEITAETPLVFSFSANNSNNAMLQYQITVHLNRDGTLAVTRRTALALPTNAADPPAQMPTVFVPSQVWTAPITEDVRVGDTLTFSDLAADRPLSNQNGDYQVQLQIIPDGAKP
jgi:hypothetical protein